MADVKNINGYTIKDATARDDIGTISSLNTTDKSNLVAAINAVNTAVGGKQPAGDYKTTQTAKTDPTASGTTITAIDTITQNTNGVITATKKTIRSASGTQTGVVQYGTATPLKDGTAAVGTGNAARVDHVHPLNVDTTAPAGLTAITGTSAAGSASTYARRDHTHSVSIRSASTSQTGIVQLNNTVTSTSTAQAATANAVKTVADRVGTLSSLTTTAKGSLVAAVNEVNGKLQARKTYTFTSTSGDSASGKSYLPVTTITEQAPNGLIGSYLLTVHRDTSDTISYYIGWLDTDSDYISQAQFWKIGGNGYSAINYDSDRLIYECNEFSSQSTWIFEPIGDNYTDN